MTKRVPAVAALLAALLALLPAASPHGAAGAREIDTRLLQDDDGLAGYAPGRACVPTVAQCPADNGAVDLLSLDVREAATPLGAPVLWFRLVYQTEKPAAGAIHLTFTAGGKDHELGWHSDDGALFTPDGFAQSVGPSPVGDGHPQALDGQVPLAALGLKPGDRLTNVAVESHGSDEDGDAMPGGWRVQGEDVDPVPNPAEPAEEFPAAYTLAGPARLLNVTASGTTLDAAHPKVTLRLANPLHGTPQFVTLETLDSSAVKGKLSSAALNLEPGQEKTVEVGATATAGGSFGVRVTSDYGAYGLVALAAAAPPPATNTTTTPSGTQGHTTTASKASPLPLPFLALAAAALAAARRRPSFAVPTTTLFP